MGNAGFHVNLMRDLAGCWKTPICCVALILRHCDVL